MQTHRIAFITDIHLNEGVDSVKRFTRDLKEISALAPPPELLVFGGDICLWSAGAASAFQELLQDCPVPQMHAMGNHDTTLDVPAGQCTRDFEALFGPVNQYRSVGPAHVITLNTCAMDPAYVGSRDWHNVLGLVPDRDLQWLEQTLAGIEDRSAPLLLFVHIPLYSTYPDRRNAGQAERDVWLVGNRECVVDLLRPFSRCIVAQGHLHENEHLEVAGIRFVSVGAVAGAWWSRQGFAECPDGSPRGYLIVDLQRHDVRLDYRAAGCAPDYQACVFLHGGRQYLNVFFAAGDKEVAVQVGSDWVPLRRETGLVMHQCWTSAHVWELPANVAPAPVNVRCWLDGAQVQIDNVPLNQKYMADPRDCRTQHGQGAKSLAVRPGA